MQISYKRKHDEAIPGLIARGGYKPLLNYQDPQMKMLGELALNHKKDIKYSQNAAIYSQADKFAKNKGLILGPYEDINNDHRNDVILYDKDGNPRYINGYSLTPSKHRLREKYYADNPTKADRIRSGGWTEYRKSFLERPDAQTWLNDPLQQDYFIPRPRRAGNGDSIYKHYLNSISDALIAAINNTFLHKTRSKSVISPFTIGSLCYINNVLYRLWQLHDNIPLVRDICTKTKNPRERYEMFKKAMAKAKNKPIAMEQYRNNFDTIMADSSVENIMQLLVKLGVSPATVERNCPTNEELENPSSVRDARVRLADFKAEIADQVEIQRNEDIKERFKQAPPGTPAAPVPRPAPVSRTVITPRIDLDPYIDEIKEFLEHSEEEVRSMIDEIKISNPEEIPAYIAANQQLLSEAPNHAGLQFIDAWLKESSE